jgi:hypothetical protein
VGELTDIRHVQLSRILNLPRNVEPGAIESLARAMSHVLADAFFAEAVDSDDVTGRESALAYLEDRLAFFGDIIGERGVADVRSEFKKRVAAWDG